MVCLCCRRPTPGDLCASCELGLRVGSARSLRFGTVRSGFVHSGTARILVHRLKYEAMPAAGRSLVERGMIDLVPPWATALVPVPRVRWRRARFGVDPAVILARHLARHTGLAVVDVLRPATVGPTHAGRGRALRTPPRYGLRRPCPDGAVLVDDVVTTGGTLGAAAATAGPAARMALTATISP